MPDYGIVDGNSRIKYPFLAREVSETGWRQLTENKFKATGVTRRLFAT